MTFEIRSEVEGDVPEIARVIMSAFETAKHRSGTEAQIVERLRESGRLTESLVAIVDGAIVGHVAMSPVRVPDSDAAWFGLGPVSVVPDWQRRGVGDALVRAALEGIVIRGAAGCVVLGDPDYYGRFGFRADPRLQYPGVPPEYFQAVAFSDQVPEGAVEYDRAFDGT